MAMRGLAPSRRTIPPAARIGTRPSAESVMSNALPDECDRSKGTICANLCAAFQELRSVRTGNRALHDAGNGPSRITLALHPGAAVSCLGFPCSEELRETPIEKA